MGQYEADWVQLRAYVKSVLKISNKSQAMNMLRDSKVRKSIQNTLAFQMAGFPKLTYILSTKMLYWSNKLYLCYQLQRELLVVGIRWPVLRLMLIFCPEYSEEYKEEVEVASLKRNPLLFIQEQEKYLSISVGWQLVSDGFSVYSRTSQNHRPWHWSDTNQELRSWSQPQQSHIIQI